ncbi:lipid asymmetry maintenance protein MlaB [Methylicorpusculum sp.]|uniref:STAS domain-containing protein n=1 Tax=Methylicorpusculum sp. TaxID=2713644 RepID=UPI0027211035|nr:STAS domain-containing protein [Methylicorpusculum sp.]MDO8845167.1 STAS domain-containing protein [Methylicorpusculum sp.]
MASKDTPSLIGFDPLAWMNNASQSQELDGASLPIPDTDNNPQEVDMQAEPGNGSPDEQNKDVQVTDAFQTENCLILEEINTIQNVQTLFEQLRTLLTSVDNMEIDASAVKTVDTSVLQCLVVFKQQALKQGKQVTIDFPSDRFIEASELLGLSKLLEVDKPVSGLF